MAPDRSNIDDDICYDGYDLTDMLQSGKNTLGILRGNGMRNARGGVTDLPQPTGGEFRCLTTARSKPF